jgi:hypothetical protein
MPVVCVCVGGESGKHVCHKAIHTHTPRAATHTSCWHRRRLAAVPAGSARK